MYFLHKEFNYSFFEINRLTIPETNLLVDGWNKELKKKESEQKKMKAKSRRGRK